MRKKRINRAKYEAISSIRWTFLLGCLFALVLGLLVGASFIFVISLSGALLIVGAAFSLIIRFTEPEPKPPEPPEQPRISYKAWKLLDEYHVRMTAGDVNIVGSYHDIDFYTDSKGVADLKNAIAEGKQFVDLNCIAKSDHSYKHHRWINLDRMSFIDDFQQVDTSKGSWSLNPEEADADIEKLIADGYTITELKAENKEAEEPVKRIKEKYKLA